MKIKKAPNSPRGRSGASRFSIIRLLIV